jgi:uncharacterized protein (TIGR03382 family)
LSNPIVVRALQITAAHELFHVMQFGGTYFRFYNWMTESTADWAITQVYPDEMLAFQFTGPYLLNFRKSLHKNTATAEDPNEFLIQYGRMLFMNDVVQRSGNPHLLEDVYNVATQTTEPLALMAAASESHTEEELFTGFVSRLAYLDWPAAERAAILDSVSDYGGGPSMPLVAAQIPAAGGERYLGTFGGYSFAIVQLARTPTGRAEVTLSIRVPSDNVQLAGTLVAPTAAGYDYTPLALSGDSSTVIVDFPADETVTSVRLAIAIISDARASTQMFDLDLAVTPAEPEDPGDDTDDAADADDGAADDTTDVTSDVTDDASSDDGEGGGCCSSSSRSLPGSMAMALVGLALVVRRRRRY